MDLTFKAGKTILHTLLSEKQESPLDRPASRAALLVARQRFLTDFLAGSCRLCFREFPE
jgi:hypothetical protein